MHGASLGPGTAPAWLSGLDVGYSSTWAPSLCGCNWVLTQIWAKSSLPGLGLHSWPNSKPSLSGGRATPQTSHRCTYQGRPTEGRPWPEGSPREWRFSREAGPVPIRGHPITVLVDRKRGDSRMGQRNPVGWGNVGSFWEGEEEPPHFLGAPRWPCTQRIPPAGRPQLQSYCWLWQTPGSL